VDCTAQGSSPVIVLNISEEILGKLPFSNGYGKNKKKKEIFQGAAHGGPRGFSNRLANLSTDIMIYIPAVV
jgi:hypothetical protein